MKLGTVGLGRMGSAASEPVPDVPGEVVRYLCGGWGPAEVGALIAPRKWHTSAED